MTTTQHNNIMCLLLSFGRPKAKRKGVFMVKLDLPDNVLVVLREKATMLNNELAEALRKKTEIEREIEDMQAKLNGLESLIHIPGAVSEKLDLSLDSTPEVNPDSFVNLPLGRAALAVLTSRGKYMTASEIVKVLKDAGRIMNSPNSRDMVTGALKKKRDKLMIRKDGTAHRYMIK